MKKNAHSQKSKIGALDKLHFILKSTERCGFTVEFLFTQDDHKRLIEAFNLVPERDRKAFMGKYFAGILLGDSKP